MKNLEMAKKLIEMIDGKHAEEMEALKWAAILCIDSVNTKKEEAKKTATKATNKKGGRKPSIDWGKAKACRAAGWSVPKIADELGCAEQTIYAKFKEEEIK